MIRSLLPALLVIVPLLIHASPGDTPCEAVEFSACTSTSSQLYTISNSNWTSASSGIVDPTGTCAGSGNLDANYWLKFSPVSDDVSILFNFTKPGGGGSIMDCGIQVYSATSCSSTFTLVTCQNNSGDGHANTGLITLTQGLIYYVRIFDASGNGSGNNFKAAVNLIKSSTIGQTACNARNISGLPFTYTGSSLCNGNTIAANCAGKTAGVTGAGEDYYFSYTSSGSEYITFNLNGLNPNLYLSLSITNPVSSCSEVKSCYNDVSLNGSFPGGLTQVPGTDSANSRTVYLSTAGLYFFIIDATGFSGSRFSMSVESFTPDTGDICSTPAAIRPIASSVTLNNASQTADIAASEPNHPITTAGFSQENSAWFTFIADTPASPDIIVTISSLNCSSPDYGYSAGMEAGIFQGNCGGSWTTISPVTTYTSGTVSITINSPVPGSQYYLVTDGSGGSQCSFSISATNVVHLPVSLTSFNAELIGELVELKWSTYSETNNNHFQIERSADAETFYPVTKVDGAGNSNEVRFYKTIDPHPNQGKNYYRIKQIDHDGKMEVLSMVMVDVPIKNMDRSFTLFPNPSEGNFNLRFSTGTERNYQVLIIDFAGRIRHQQEITEGMSEVPFELNHLESGMYIIHLISENEKLTEKIIIK